MKIAILSTPWIAVPPIGYGGIELVVANLTEGLVKKGHEVMLFATGDSKTSARLEYFYEKALGNDRFLKDNTFLNLQHTYEFFKLLKSEKFDIVHNNNQYFPMFFFDLQETPFIHTLHGAFYKDLISPSGFVKEKRDILLAFKNHPYVSISNHQQTSMPQLNYVKTVYNGIIPEQFELSRGDGNYLAWIGRITSNKGIDTAINVARKLNIPIKIAGFIDPGDKEYFEKEIKPLVDDNVEFVGELKDLKVKSDFLGGAIATLFPIRWHEPFGLVMIESMACGTPVIAFNKGSVPEIVENGKSGFIVETEEEMTEAVKKVGQIDRSYCRQHAVKNFNVDVMVDGYLEAYKKVLDSSSGLAS